MRHLILLITMAANPLFAESAPALSEIVSAVPRPVVSAHVGNGHLQETTYIGTVAAGYEVALGFPIGGTLIERRVDLGALVAKDDILARLDSTDIQSELRSAQAGVLVAETNYGSAEQAWQRAVELAERGVDAQTRQEDAQRSLVAAQAGLEQARANLALVQDKLDLATLRAPQAGVITAAFQDVGALVSPGLEVLRLANADNREIVVDISEQGLAALEIGMTFDVALVANPQLRTTARLARVDPVAQSLTRNRRAHLVLSDPPQGFRFGALVEVRAIADESTVISVPLSAVLRSGTDFSVWIVDRNQNVVNLRQITLGAQFGDHVRVISGIDVSDEVVLRGIHSLHENQPIGRSVSQ
ncbi:RND family efflux transporter, MFP subunit [Yoonia tamlensis]|uniref:RND family efflux transporter, MFP subunit n=1 Tax=Yoonia tamlensis TaxID=390270 RepID=A0A1I6HEZ3_9RHOB|nr:efflux RND transporter periplasmic adaptor subunit [Yoonia tamlensis]SFR53062.1 RND family efflux transporter, MFP subunit [Yoonia tamlensis]